MNKTLIHIVEDSAEKFPYREAYKCGDVSISFLELNRRSNQLAHYLVKLGVRSGNRVGIYLPRCLESVVAVYGIMKAGAAFVPLDPMAPTSRTRFLIEDCGIEVLITAKSQTKRFSRIVERGTSLKGVIGLERDLGVSNISWSVIYESTHYESKLSEVHSNDLAYIMYTSGSTGTPKGIMHTHKSGLNYAKLSAQLYGLNHEDRVAGHAPLHFDISTFSYFTAPLAGACTVIIPEAFTKLPASLSMLMEKEKVTIWYSVPLALIQLLSNGLLDQRDLSSLKWVLFGGEVFAPKHIRALMKLWPQATFCNVYGPAEINQCTYYHINSPPKSDEQIPLGKIWFSAAYKILDEKDLVASRGEVGELVVKSESMMKGYWNNPDLTNKSTYREKAKDGVEHAYYRTGDLVDEDANGDLVFHGRRDRQIKLRGYRVEMDEIEAVLSKHVGVEEAATFLMENDEHGVQIGAAVITTADSHIDSMKLASYCRGHLPAYAVPSRIELLSEFPRTSSGKIKRSELSKQKS